MTRTIFNDGWQFRPKVTAFMELGGSSASSWADVLLPHDALIATERRADVARGETSGFFPGGAFEYKRTLHVGDELRGSQVILEFDGVYRDAAVFVNGNLAGQRAYGYSRFFVQIDPYLDFGADNEIRVECRAHLDSRWYTGAGIYRDVHLIVKNPAHIVHDGVRITTPDIDSERAVVEVAVEVENSGPVTTTLTLAARVQGTDAASSSPVTLLPGTRATVRRRLYVSQPELWSPESPSLYAVDLTLTDGDQVVDEVSSTFGIRSLTLDPKHGLRLNGDVVKLRGACIHSDNGPLGAVSMAPAEERRVRLLKEAGFNAIRSAHNPMSTALLDACDKLGMLVMDETFDMWTSSKSDYDYAFDFPQWWERDVESMVARDFNHPSVIFYSIGNEIPETGNPIGSTWGRKLAEKVRSLDSTRYVTNGINGFVSMLDTIIPQMQARREAAADSARGRRQHDDGRVRSDDEPHPDLAARDRPHRRVLCRARRGRYELRRSPLRTRPRALPRPHHRRNRDLAVVDRRQLGAREGQRSRHRRLHLDRLGLPRRDRDRCRPATSTSSKAAPLRSPVGSPNSPPGVATSTSLDTAAPSPTSARSSSACAPTRTSRSTRPPTTTARSRSRRRGRGATRSRTGPGAAAKANPSRSTSTATRTRSNCSSTERPSVLRPSRGSGHRSRPPTSRAKWP